MIDRFIGSILYTKTSRYFARSKPAPFKQKKMDLFRRFDVSKLRTHLNLAETRIDLMKNKKTNELKKQKVEIATLLQSGEEELARIRAEHMVREDFNIEVFGILGLLCALMRERVKLLETSANIPYDMKESCTTIVYAAQRVDIPELNVVRDQLMLKFKKELQGWMSTEEKLKENVNERVFDKLSVKPPNAYVVTRYMQAIADEYNIPWSPDESDPSLNRFDQPAAAPTGASITAGAGSGIRTPYYVTDGSLSPVPNQGVVEPLFSKPGAGGGGGAKGGGGGSGGGVVPSLFADSPGQPAAGDTVPSLGSASLNAAAASKKKVEQTKPASAATSAASSASASAGAGPDLFPPAAPVTTNANAVPGYDELAARFEALKRG